MERLAVVLFNLGGPDGPRAIEPFLFNLFNDAAIIQAPGPLRWILAKFISRKRAPQAREIYKNLGGKSPLLEETQAQADALALRLEDVLEDGAGEVRVFIAMRYWHPMSEETVQAVKAFGPDEIILLPLYPQYSTTTTASSLKEWHARAIARGLDRPTRAICCYPANPGLIKGQAALIAPAIAEAEDHGRPRILFSAHGLPEKIIAQGDPYQWQIEQTAQAIVDALDSPGIDWAVCYQSRVGPLRWIGPTIDEELSRAARDKTPVVVVPVAFVSEHSETLVELDIQYRDVAHERGVPHYVRVPALGVQEDFIGGLAGLVEAALGKGMGGEKTLCPADGARLCPAGHGKCPVTGS